MRYRFSHKIKSWIRLLSLTLSAQFLIQAIGLLGGIIIIRFLNKEEYAYYTIANTMLGTMTILADGGISQAVLSQGGKNWNYREQFSKVVVTGLKLRRQFAIGSLILAIPILGYILHNNDANLGTIILIVIAIIPAFYTSLSDTIYQIALKLHQDIKPLQINQLMVGFSRFILVVGLSIVTPFSYVFLLIDGVTKYFGNLRLKRLSKKSVDYEMTEDLEVRAEMLKLVRRILPASLYFCFYSQITVWLISFFGTTEKVAEIGALSRLTVATASLSIVFSVLITPRYAKLPNDYNALLSKFTQVLLLSILICGGMIITVYFTSDFLLWILGNDYKSLNIELVLLFFANGLALISGFIYALYVSRGWMIKPYIYIPINFITLACCVFYFDMNELVGVIFVNIIVNFVMFLINLIYCYYKIFNLREN